MANESRGEREREEVDWIFFLAQFAIQIRKIGVLSVGGWTFKSFRLEVNFSHNSTLIFYNLILSCSQSYGWRDTHFKCCRKKQLESAWEIRWSCSKHSSCSDFNCFTYLSRGWRKKWGNFKSQFNNYWVSSFCTCFFLIIFNSWSFSYFGIIMRSEYKHFFHHLTTILLKIPDVALHYFVCQKSCLIYNFPH